LASREISSGIRSGGHSVDTHDRCPHFMEVGFGSVAAIADCPENEGFWDRLKPEFKSLSEHFYKRTGCDFADRWNLLYYWKKS
jgi:hypothetical protein